MDKVFVFTEHQIAEVNVRVFAAEVLALEYAHGIIGSFEHDPDWTETEQSCPESRLWWFEDKQGDMRMFQIHEEKVRELPKVPLRLDENGLAEVVKTEDGTNAFIGVDGTYFWHYKDNVYVDIQESFWQRIEPHTMLYIKNDAEDK